MPAPAKATNGGGIVLRSISLHEGSQAIAGFCLQNHYSKTLPAGVLSHCPAIFAVHTRRRRSRSYPPKREIRGRSRRSAHARSPGRGFRTPDSGGTPAPHTGAPAGRRRGRLGVGRARSRSAPGRSDRARCVDRIMPVPPYRCFLLPQSWHAAHKTKTSFLKGMGISNTVFHRSKIYSSPGKPSTTDPTPASFHCPNLKSTLPVCLDARCNARRCARGASVTPGFCPSATASYQRTRASRDRMCRPGVIAMQHMIQLHIERQPVHAGR